MIEKVSNNAIMELGITLDDFAEKHGITNDEIRVTMPLGKDDFRKLDEDIYYRNIGNVGGQEYEPSVGKMNIKFKHATITVEEK